MERCYQKCLASQILLIVFTNNKDWSCFVINLWSSMRCLQKALQTILFLGPLWESVWGGDHSVYLLNMFLCFRKLKPTTSCSYISVLETADFCQMYKENTVFWKPNAEFWAYSQLWIFVDALTVWFSHIICFITGSNCISKLFSLFAWAHLEYQMGRFNTIRPEVSYHCGY